MLPASSKGDGSGGFPDVCKAPAPPAPFVPTPFPNLPQLGTALAGLEAELPELRQKLEEGGAEFDAVVVSAHEMADAFQADIDAADDRMEEAAELLKTALAEPEATDLGAALQELGSTLVGLGETVDSANAAIRAASQVQADFVALAGGASPAGAVEAVLADALKTVEDEVSAAGELIGQFRESIGEIGERLVERHADALREALDSAIPAANAALSDFGESILRGAHPRMLEVLIDAVEALDAFTPIREAASVVAPQAAAARAVVDGIQDLMDALNPFD